ncbi:rhodanese-like domain-containing protein [Gordonia sp. VNQ95]|uniref:rhodanese-like domain-containing protein n=1 Tax=Gordonia TaxID=2053 RepID=UPI0032B5F76C
MTASVQLLAPVSAPAPSAPLSLRIADYRDALAAGATPIDVRSQRKRQADGALLGAIAVDAAEAIDLLTPGSPSALRIAAGDARWILVSDDGHEAEWLAWHLQARGVPGAVFVIGGYRGLRRAGINGQINQGELDVFSAH